MASVPEVPRPMMPASGVVRMAGSLTHAVTVG